MLFTEDSALLFKENFQFHVGFKTNIFLDMEHSFLSLIKQSYWNHIIYVNVCPELLCFTCLHIKMFVYSGWRQKNLEKKFNFYFLKRICFYWLNMIWSNMIHSLWWKLDSFKRRIEEFIFISYSKLKRV